MPCEGDLLLCYNKGCGKTFDPSQNKQDSCTFHPGVAVFHDAYKGWSCCKKKSTDFTEFLNIKGCTVSFHNNVKPEEPQKPVVDKSKADEIIEYRAPKPITPEEVLRPPFDTPLITITPTVSEALRQQVATCNQDSSEVTQGYEGTGEIPIGTTCKNNGCKQTYEGPQIAKTSCIFHPGYPVFHEGLKFWSCCTKRTTDFDTFMAQVGCKTDEHVWFKPKSGEGNSVKCRLDWHQTGSAVFVSIFAKKYDPDQSVVQLSPVRLKVMLVFPEQGGTYSNDIELRGVIKVDQSSVQMLPTKVEIRLKKSNGASWSSLELPKSKPTPQPETVEPVKKDLALEEHMDAVDLSDL